MRPAKRDSQNAKYDPINARLIVPFRSRKCPRPTRIERGSRFACLFIDLPVRTRIDRTLTGPLAKPCYDLPFNTQTTPPSQAEKHLHTRQSSSFPSRRRPPPAAAATTMPSLVSLIRTFDVLSTTARRSLENRAGCAGVDTAYLCVQGEPSAMVDYSRSIAEANPRHRSAVCARKPPLVGQRQVHVLSTSYPRPHTLADRTISLFLGESH